MLPGSESSKNVDISVILPCYNERENLGPLVEELVQALRVLQRPYEIIFVDDASEDGSVEVLRRLQERHGELRLLRHRSNCGQSASLLTGIRHARGRILVSMDADMQYDPGDIAAMLEALEGCDVVCGVRQRRMDSWAKRLCSRIANRFRAAVLRDSIHDAGCTFRAFRRRVVETDLVPFKGLHRFFPTICKLHGLRVAEIPVQHRPRRNGRSKYGIWDRLGVGLLDLMAMRWYRRRMIAPDRLLKPPTGPAGD